MDVNNQSQYDRAYKVNASNAEQERTRQASKEKDAEQTRFQNSLKEANDKYKK